MSQKKKEADSFQRKSGKGKVIGIIIGIMILIGVIIGLMFYSNYWRDQPDDSQKVYVTNVGELTGTGNVSGISNRYSGVVETQKSVTVEKDSEMEVESLKVKVGDLVKEGDILFTYDTDSLKLSRSEKELEVEQIESENESSNKQIEQLTAEMKKVKEEDKFQYEYQILQLQTSIKKNEYEIKSKKLEIDDLNKNIHDNKVKSEIDGIVKTINKETPSEMEQSDSGFITIMAVGDYRIKGTVNEQNVRYLSEGDIVTVHSRVDDSITWSGSIDTIDTDHAEEGSAQGEEYYGDDSGNSGSTDYSFYVELDSAEGLMMGQHVYIEIGDSTTDQEIKMSLYQGYILQEDGTSYVWAENEDGRLEKRTVTLGVFDEDFESYVIVDGLTPEDYIAWPDAALKEGMPVTTNPSEAMVPSEGDLSEGDMTDSSYEGDESLDGSYEGDESLDGSYEGDESLDGSYEGEESLDGSYEGDESLGGSYEGDESLDGSYEGDESLDESGEEIIKKNAEAVRNDLMTEE